MPSILLTWRATIGAVIATDTCKNTVYVLAKHDPLDSIESFGIAIAQHFVDTHSQVDACEVALSERVWSRLLESPHSFVANQRATPTATVRVARGEAPQVTAGITQLLIAKTTESGFSDFNQSEFRTLADTDEQTAFWQLR